MFRDDFLGFGFDANAADSADAAHSADAAVTALVAAAAAALQPISQIFSFTEMYVVCILLPDSPT